VIEGWSSNGRIVLASGQIEKNGHGCHTNDGVMAVAALKISKWDSYVFPILKFFAFYLSLSLTTMS
jgi:hypothetical protein